MKLQRPLKWDPAKETFGSDTEANALLARKQRQGYGTNQVYERFQSLRTDNG
jgi:hypothetical protein